MGGRRQAHADAAALPLSGARGYPRFRPAIEWALMVGNRRVPLTTPGTFASDLLGHQVENVENCDSDKQDAAALEDHAGEPVGCLSHLLLLAFDLLALIDRSLDLRALSAHFGIDLLLTLNGGVVLTLQARRAEDGPRGRILSFGVVGLFDQADRRVAIALAKPLGFHDGEITVVEDGIDLPAAALVGLQLKGN